MSSNNIVFSEKTATKEQICFHLCHCDKERCQMFSSRVDLREYSIKLFRKSITFEAWSNYKLVGLVAAYLNNPDNRIGYITNVSVMKSHSGHGIALKLLRMCIEKAGHLNIRLLQLEVSADNFAAIKLYEKCGFTSYENKEKTMFMKCVVDMDGRYE